MKKHEGVEYDGKAEIARYYMHAIQFSSWIKFLQHFGGFRCVVFCVCNVEDSGDESLGCTVF